MTAKFSQARKDAFLHALRETGNQTIAAERAKVSSSWVQLHRSDDPAFRRAMEEAVAEAKARLGLHPEREPPAGWGFLDGEELVVRGTGGSGGGKRVQIARARLKQWSPRVEERFLATLASTCNVKAACAEVRMTAASAYNHRKRWEGFARRWDEAIDIGYMRIEAGLLRAGENFLSGKGPPEDAPLRGMTVTHALHMLHMHQKRVHGIGKAPGVGWQRPKTLAELAPGIMAKLRVYAQIQRGEPSEEQIALDEEEWARRRGSAAA
jgi:hypothetical protein